MNISHATHRVQSLCHAFRIAVLATLTELRATRNRVPCHLSPLDIRSCRHSKVSEWKVLYRGVMISRKAAVETIRLQSPSKACVQAHDGRRRRASTIPSACCSPPLQHSHWRWRSEE